jgi:predicted metal-dependent hydrolase
MTIDERGLAVGAPHHVTLAGIEAFVRGHGEWVLAKLAEYAQRAAPRHGVNRKERRILDAGHVRPPRN